MRTAKLKEFPETTELSIYVDQKLTELSVYPRTMDGLLERRVRELASRGFTIKRKKATKSTNEHEQFKREIWV